MLRSWFICAAILTGFSAASAPADDPKTPAEKAEEFQRQATQKLTLIQNDIAGVKSRLDALESNRAATSDAIDVNYKLDDLRNELRRLRADLNLAGKQSTSEFSRMPNLPGEPTPKRSESLRLGSGTVRLITEFPFTQELLVNGIPHLLAPGESRDVPVTAGTFTYEGLSTDYLRRVSTVPAGMVKPIRIFPRW
jgi:hypothetical protein